MSIKKSNVIALKRKLKHLHVVRNVCLVSLQQKNQTRLFIASFPMGAIDLIASFCFKQKQLAIKCEIKTNHDLVTRISRALRRLPVSSLSSHWLIIMVSFCSDQ